MKQNYDKDEVLSRMLGMWKVALMKLCNAPAHFFNGRHQPCLYCGGKDRARWTDNLNRKGDGGNICNQCGNDTGIGLFMRLTGENFSDAINTLGDWLNLVPVDVIVKANKQAARDSGYKFGAQADHEKCEYAMNKTKAHEFTPLSRCEGFFALDGESYTCGEKIASDGSVSLIHAIPCRMVYEDGLSDEMCNIAFINQSGVLSFLARDFTRGAVAPTGSTDKTIYLCDNWIDSQHVHIATGGQEVWTTFNAANAEIVAYRYKGSRNMRVVCRSDNLDMIYAADDRGLNVMIPIGGDFKKGIERKLYDPASLIK